MEETANNVLESATPSLFTTHKVFWIVGLLAVVVLSGVIVTAYLNYNEYVQSPWWSERVKAQQFDIFSWFKGKPTLHQDLELREETQETQERQERRERQESSVHPTARRETWCLIGEDLSGRYCVRVPGPDSCTHERSFLSQDQCELTPAMHLPGGVQMNQATRLDLLNP